MADSPHLLATAQDVEVTSDDHGGAAEAPTMPHNEHPAGELDRLYPSLVPPPDEGLDDGAADARDGVYQHGLSIAEEIREKTAAEGRRKRPLAMVTCPRAPRQPDLPSRSVCGGVTRRGIVDGGMAVGDSGCVRRHAAWMRQDAGPASRRSDSDSPILVCRSICQLFVSSI